MSFHPKPASIQRLLEKIKEAKVYLNCSEFPDNCKTEAAIKMFQIEQELIDTSPLGPAFHSLTELVMYINNIVDRTITEAKEQAKF